MRNEITIAGKILRLSPLATPSVASEIIDFNAQFVADLTRLRLGQDAMESMGHTMDRVREFMGRILLLSIKQLQPNYSGSEIAALSSAELCRAVRGILLLTDETSASASSPGVH